MKVKIVAVNRADIQGISKKGTPYHINELRLTAEIPFDSPDGFGVKHHEYVVGKAVDFDKYAHLRGKLPVDAELTLTSHVNDYGQVVTVVSDVKLDTPKADKA